MIDYLITYGFLWAIVSGLISYAANSHPAYHYNDLEHWFYWFIAPFFFPIGCLVNAYNLKDFIKSELKILFPSLWQ
jgi:hypothetical protein